MPKPTPGRRWRPSWRCPAVLVIAVLGLTLGSQAPASAHWNLMTRTVVPYYSANAICVRAYAEQDHDHSVIRTETLGPPGCNAGINTNAVGDIRHRAQWFADGRYCAYVEEQRSDSTRYQYQTNVSQDVWYLGCNNGPGVNVYITMDTWNWAWSFRENRWVANYGGDPGQRPITGHCHCP